MQTAHSLLLSASGFSLPKFCLEKAKWMKSEVCSAVCSYVYIVREEKGQESWNNNSIKHCVEQYNSVPITYLSLHNNI